MSGFCSTDERLISSSASAGWWVIEPSILCTLCKKKKKANTLLARSACTPSADKTCSLQSDTILPSTKRRTPSKNKEPFLFLFFFLFLLSCMDEEKKVNLFQTLHEKLKNASPPARFSTSTHRQRYYCYLGLTHRIWNFINLYLHLIAQCHGCTISTTSLFGSL